MMVSTQRMPRRARPIPPRRPTPLDETGLRPH